MWSHACSWRKARNEEGGEDATVMNQDAGMDMDVPADAADDSRTPVRTDHNACEGSGGGFEDEMDGVECADDSPAWRRTPPARQHTVGVACKEDAFTWACQSQAGSDACPPSATIEDVLTVHYNQLLQCLKIVQDMGINIVVPQTYEDAVCSLARLMEVVNLEVGAGVPLTHLQLVQIFPRMRPCTHGAGCKGGRGPCCTAPRFASDLQRTVFEQNHILQRKLVAEDPCIKVADRVLRRAMVEAPDFVTAVTRFVGAMEPRVAAARASAAASGRCSMQQYSLAPFTLCFHFLGSSTHVEVVFPARVVWAAFLSCESLWATLPNQPVFGACAVGAARATATSGAAAATSAAMVAPPQWRQHSPVRLSRRAGGSHGNRFSCTADREVSKCHGKHSGHFGFGHRGRRTAYDGCTADSAPSWRGRTRASSTHVAEDDE